MGKHKSMLRKPLLQRFLKPREDGYFFPNLFPVVNSSVCMDMMDMGCVSDLRHAFNFWYLLVFGPLSVFLPFCACI
jgi:hypothetical protein